MVRHLEQGGAAGSAAGLSSVKCPMPSQLQACRVRSAPYPLVVHREISRQEYLDIECEVPHALTPVRREISRQEYLKKREEAKLEELKEALEDEKYLFQVGGGQGPPDHSLQGGEGKAELS